MTRERERERERGERGRERESVAKMVAVHLEGNNCWDIFLKTINVNVTMLLREKSCEHQSEREPSSGDHDCLRRTTWQRGVVILDQIKMTVVFSNSPLSSPCDGPVDILWSSVWFYRCCFRNNWVYMSSLAAVRKWSFYYVNIVWFLLHIIFQICVSFVYVATSPLPTETLISYKTTNSCDISHEYR